MSTYDVEHFEFNSNIELKSTIHHTILELAHAKKVRQHHIKHSDGYIAKIAACIEIQRVYRGYQSRKFNVGLNELQTTEHQTPRHLHIKHTKLTELPLGITPRSNERTSNESREQRSRTNTSLTPFDAAIKVQRWWRCILDMNLYRYYRDLLNFRQKGDPALMLRCINPIEAKLADSAAGVHVKFRLAGEHFPPRIYYKVFTHRPIQDIGSYAPRDYTKADCKRRIARDVHNKTVNGDQVPDQSGWYKRVDRNGWRLVSDQLIQEYTRCIDPVTVETSQKAVTFHHSRLQRKADIERRRKQKKIDWMTKMYRQGTLQHESASSSESIETFTESGPEDSDDLQDSEVQELLDWSTSLDFTVYSNDWNAIGTSAMSEAATIERRVLKQSLTDPFGLTLGAAAHNTNMSSMSFAYSGD